MVSKSAKRKNNKNTSQVKSKKLKNELDEKILKQEAEQSEDEEVDGENLQAESSEDETMIKPKLEEDSETESKEIEDKTESEEIEDETESEIDDNEGDDGESSTSGEELPVYEDKNPNQSDDEENSGKLNRIPFDTTKSMKNDDLYEKYMNRKGKSLHILFPHKLPLKESEVEKYVKEFCPNINIIKVRRPRQKSSRFCLVDFENIEERTKGMEKLKTVEVKGKKLIVSFPKTENDDFIAELIEKRNKKKEILRTKRKLRREALKNASVSEMGTKLRTSTVIVTNIPAESSLLDVNSLFPNAVDVKVKFAKEKDQTSVATVTLPTPDDATKIVHSKYEIGDNKLKVVYANTKHVQCNDLLESNDRSKKTKPLSNTIVVTNIPPESSIVDITQAFPKAKDIKVDFAKDNTQTSSARVIFKNPEAANEARKQSLKLGENNLRMTFDLTHQKPIGQRTPLVFRNSSAPGSGHRTSIVLVKSIPKGTTESELKNLIPNAVEIKLKPPNEKYDSTMAIVTLPTPDDASEVHKKTFKIGENSLKIFFSKEFKFGKKSHIGKPKFVGKNSNKEKNRVGISNKFSKIKSQPEGSVKPSVEAT